MKPASAVEPAPGCPPALHYVSDGSPGYSRRILNDKPAYFDQQGKRIRDPETIRRINALAIPPAYRDVWICPPPGSTLALAALRQCLAEGREPSRQAVVDTVKDVAKRLGNTPSVCRKCYIHPAILDAFLEAGLDRVKWSTGRARRRWLKPEEVDLLSFLQHYSVDGKLRE